MSKNTQFLILYINIFREKSANSMAGWNGFTEQELSNLKSNENLEHKKTLGTEKTDKTFPAKKLKKPRSANVAKTKKDTNDKKLQQVTTTVDETNVITVKQPVITEEMKHDKKVQESEKMVEGNELTKDQKTSFEITNNEKDEEIVDEKVIRVLTDSEAVEAQMSSLAKLQIQQKEIEEENKKKQSMIKETIAERMRQTQDESNKLKNINKELSKLDHLLQVDVTILRDKIDEACAEFSHAQRRFNEAEKEYVAAKLDFFKKKDQKDELQEHLYAIIQENEKRKAQKLEQLMQKLNATADV